MLSTRRAAHWNGDEFPAQSRRAELAGQYLCEEGAPFRGFLYSILGDLEFFNHHLGTPGRGLPDVIPTRRAPIYVVVFLLPAGAQIASIAALAGPMVAQGGADGAGTMGHRKWGSCLAAVGQAPAL